MDKTDDGRTRKSDYPSGGDPPNEATDIHDSPIIKNSTSLRIPASFHSAEPGYGSALRGFTVLPDFLQYQT